MLDEAQVKAAAKALLIYAQKQQGDSLFEEDAFISMALTLKKVPEKGRVKPWRIPIEHSLYTDKSICLITKDPQASFKAALEKEPIPGVDKVIGLSKLRKNYRQYKERRRLLHTYDLFLADDRVLPMLPALLGVKFFEKKKHPMPVCLKGNFKGEVERARDSTAFHLPSGACCMIRVARTSFNVDQVVANVMGAVANVVERIPRKWKNIQSVFLRTHDSPALPVFNSLPTVNRIHIGAPRPPVKSSAPASTTAARKRKRPLAQKTDDAPPATTDAPAATPKKPKTAASRPATARKATTTPAKGVKKTKKAPGSVGAKRAKK